MFPTFLKGFVFFFVINENNETIRFPGSVINYVQIRVLSEAPGMEMEGFNSSESNGSIALFLIADVAKIYDLRIYIRLKPQFKF